MQEVLISLAEGAGRHRPPPCRGGRRHPGRRSGTAPAHRGDDEPRVLSWVRTDAPRACAAGVASRSARSPISSSLPARCTGAGARDDAIHSCSLHLDGKTCDPSHPGKPAPLYCAGRPVCQCTIPPSAPNGDIYVSDGYGTTPRAQIHPRRQADPLLGTSGVGKGGSTCRITLLR